MDLLFVPGKLYLSFACFVLGVFGVFEIIEGSIIITESNGIFAGGWYLGVLCLLAGVRGFYLTTSRSVLWVMLWVFIAWIAAIICSTMLYSEYYEVKDLKACAEYDGTISFSCGITSNYTCYGNANYFTDAINCEQSYVDSHTDDYYLLQNQQCDCTKSNAVCQSFENIVNCNNLLSFLPTALFDSLIISILCFILSALIIVLCCVILYLPTVFITREELERRQRELSEVQAEIFHPNEVLADATIINPRNTNSSEAYLLNPLDVMVVKPRNSSASASSLGSGGSSRQSVRLQAVPVQNKQNPLFTSFWSFGSRNSHNAASQQSQTVVTVSNTADETKNEEKL